MPDCPPTVGVPADAHAAGSALPLLPLLSPPLLAMVKLVLALAALVGTAHGECHCISFGTVSDRPDCHANTGDYCPQPPDRSIALAAQRCGLGPENCLMRYSVSSAMRATVCRARTLSRSLITLFDFCLSLQLLAG